MRGRALPFDSSFGPASGRISNKYGAAHNDTPRRGALHFDCSLDFEGQHNHQPRRVIPTIGTRLKSQGTVNNLPNRKVSTMRTHQNRPQRRSARSTIVDRGPAERSSELPERPRSARGRKQRLRKHRFNMGTAMGSDQARFSNFRQCEPTRTVRNAVWKARQSSIDHANTHFRK